MVRLLLSVDDLSYTTVDRILRRADGLRRGSREVGTDGNMVVGLIFLEASLRTRLGFAVAAARLGWRSVDVAMQRSSSTSMPESWQDTVRTVSGLVDVVVARLGRPSDRERIAAVSVAPYINGGDAGPKAEHPSQALIDAFAMEQQLGPLSELRIAICGDLRMRAVRSLIHLLAQRPPRLLALIAEPEVRDHDSLPSSLRAITGYRTRHDLADIDVLYVAGIPHGALPEPARERLRVDQSVLATLPEASIVLSPLPVLDEIDSAARSDPRVRMFHQSDLSTYVRMAVLVEMVDPATGLGDCPFR